MAWVVSHSWLNSKVRSRAIHSGKVNVLLDVQEGKKFRQLYRGSESSFVFATAEAGRFSVGVNLIKENMENNNALNRAQLRVSRSVYIKRRI